MLSRSSVAVRCADALSVATRAASTAAAGKTSGNRVKTFEIYRFNPEKQGAKPEMQVRKCCITQHPF